MKFFMSSKTSNKVPSTVHFGPQQEDPVIANEELQLRTLDDDLQAETLPVEEAPKVVPSGCPFASMHGSIPAGDVPAHAFHFVPLRMKGNSGRTHSVSDGSRSLINNEVSFEDLQVMTEKFYELAFQDETLDQFIASHDDPHGSRFAKWIHQKLSGSTIWDEDRRFLRDRTPHELAGGHQIVVHDRSSAHVAAWYSPKRPAADVGRHFTLEECRVWMRLHFWALRLSGVMEKSPSFADYYVRFIGHFVSVYERTAPQFARDSFRWSADPKNTEKYIADGRIMKDVIGLTFAQAVAQVDSEEIDDDEWPYNQVEDYD